MSLAALGGSEAANFHLHGHNAGIRTLLLPHGPRGKCGVNY